MDYSIELHRHTREQQASKSTVAGAQHGSTVREGTRHHKRWEQQLDRMKTDLGGRGRVQTMAEEDTGGRVTAARAAAGEDGVLLSQTKPPMPPKILKRREQHLKRMREALGSPALRFVEEEGGEGQKQHPVYTLCACCVLQ